MRYKVSLKRIILHAPIGVYKQEKVEGNDFEIDITLDISYPNETIRNDNIYGVIDYSQVAEIAKQVMLYPYDLLETAAFNIAHAIKERFTCSFPLITDINVKLAKLAPPVAGIDIERAQVEITLDCQDSERNE